MIGYLDIPAGLSGDMMLGCLVDAGLDIEHLRAALRALGLPEGSWSVEPRRVMKGAIRATLVDVRVTEGHDHHHDHGHSHHHHAHHRGLREIRHIIGHADLSPGVKERAVAVFTRLAEAEAKVHGTTIDKVHFHEVGAMDAIVDIVGVCAALEALGVERLYASPVPLGSGWINTQHGRLPVPAPATMELLTSAQAPTVPGPGEGELTTPTGAAILATLATFGQPPMRVTRVGLGAGQRDCAWPNIARLCLGEAVESVAPPVEPGDFVQIDTNIDDMNPQLYASVVERLFEAGAVDAWLVPIQMKKGRPAVMLSALAEARLEKSLADLILRETTTLGVRVSRVHRHIADRDMRTIDTPLGPVRVKLKKLASSIVGAAPEFADCQRIAAERKLPVRTVYESAMAAAARLIDAG